jgi:exopolyphosphatase/guanosine-5'-triphosphate,3'-diphosphate pyrophosphatase
MKNGNYAVLDLGTNTFNLLTVNIDNNVKTVIHEDRVPVKIGKDGIQNKIITEDACNRAIEAVKYFKKTLDFYEVEKVQAVATSAFRNAQNGQELARRIKNETGIEIQIIDGNKEAELIYYGVKSGMTIGEDVSLIMDIGGGSVEFIICDENHIFWKKSYEIGAQRLLDKFHQIDPIPKENIEQLYSFLENNLQELDEQVKLLKPTVLIGSSGTFDTLCEIYIAENNIDHTLDIGSEFELPIKYFDNIFSSIVTKNVKERLEIKGMSPMRVDMIVVACCIINYVIKKYKMKRIRTSFYSLKEGLLYIMKN